MSVEPCGLRVSWWDGEYLGACELPKGHAGNHWDGLSWFDDDGRLRDDDHLDESGALVTP